MLVSFHLKDSIKLTKNGMELTSIHARVLISYWQWHRWDSIFIPKPHSPAQPDSAMLSMAPHWAPSRWPLQELSSSCTLWGRRLEHSGTRALCAGFSWKLLIPVRHSLFFLHAWFLKVFHYGIPHLQPSCLSVVYGPLREPLGASAGKGKQSDFKYVFKSHGFGLCNQWYLRAWGLQSCVVIQRKKKIKSFLVSNSHKTKQQSGRWDLHQELCLCRLAFVPGSFLCKPWRDVLLVTRATKCTASTHYCLGKTGFQQQKHGCKRKTLINEYWQGGQ